MNAFYNNLFIFILTDSYPFMISIWHRPNDKHGCGGALVTLLHVLTAGHCVQIPNAKDVLMVWFV